MIEILTFPSSHVPQPGNVITGVFNKTISMKCQMQHRTKKNVNKNIYNVILYNTMQCSTLNDTPERDLFTVTMI